VTYQLPQPVVAIAPARLYVLIGCLFVLGVLIIGLAVQSTAPIVARAVMSVFGAFLIWQAFQRYGTKDVALALTDAGLEQTDGKILASWDQIVSIDRGALALKPSNGFTLILSEKQPRGWVPGLWWRLGRRIGVGGIASAGAAKFMAEQIDAKIKARG